MNIFEVILHNFTLRSRTRKPDDRVPCPEGFRGELVHQTSLCTLCGSCAYVCSSGAIHIERNLENGKSGSWNYDAGRCTFCERCTQYCPTRALTISTQPVRLFGERHMQQSGHIVAYQHCTSCGATITPLPVETLVRLYHNEDAAREAMSANLLCPSCRARQYSQRFKRGLRGQAE